jgi:hypothetical protein
MNGNKSKETILFKNILQEGMNSVVDGSARSFIGYRVQCLLPLIVPVNRCMQCPHNKGLLNQYVMKCARNPGTELPEVITAEKDPNYPTEPEKKEEKSDV